MNRIAIITELRKHLPKDKLLNILDYSTEHLILLLDFYK